jgi:nucleoside-diphosphate-sugar epimerase
MTVGLVGSKALVVGGAGFVGSALVRALLMQGVDEIIVVDNLISADRSNLVDHPSVRFIENSINDAGLLASLPGDLDFVWHLACYHGNQSSIADPIADHEHGALTSLNLFQRLKDIGCLRKVVYSAAGCAVAQKTRDEPLATREDAAPSMFQDSPYSISKLMGELYGNYFFGRYGLPFVKARFQNVYGPGEILGAGVWRGTAHTVWRNVIPTFVFKALHGESLPLDDAGRTSRDFIFVEDVVQGLIACALRGAAGEAYNIASGTETTIREVADRINLAAGNSANHTLGAARDWDRSGRRFADPTKSRDNLGFSAQISLEEGVRRTVDWTRDNLALIKRCMSGHRMHTDLARYLTIEDDNRGQA